MVMPDFSNHEIYFEKLGEAELQSWKRLGLQTIYRGNGVEHRSDITWVSIEELWGSNGIADTVFESSADSRYYDLQGRTTDAHARGLVLQRIIKPDGTTATVKVFRK